MKEEQNKDSPPFTDNNLQQGPLLNKFSTYAPIVDNRIKNRNNPMQNQIFKLSLLLIAICISTIVHAQSFNKQEQIVQQTIVKLFDALSNSDTAGLRLHSTADVNFYEYGEVWTIDTLIHKVTFAKPADYKRTNTFDFVNTTIDGNTAWATYYLQSAIKRNGKQELVKWMETVVLVKQKKQWKIKLLHSSLIERT